MFTKPWLYTHYYIISIFPICNNYSIIVVVIYPRWDLVPQLLCHSTIRALPARGETGRAQPGSLAAASACCLEKICRALRNTEAVLFFKCRVGTLGFQDGVVSKFWTTLLSPI